jgi:hypothetical protein
MYVVLAWAAVFVAIVAVAAALVLKKRRKLIAAVASVVFAAIAIVGLVWFTQASVYYSFDSAASYPRAGDNYITLNCKNTGYVEGTFSLVTQFMNANFSAETDQPYERLSDSAAKFTHTLRGGEKQSTKVYFSIHENVTEFFISLSYQQNGDAFLTQSDPDGNTYLSYVKEPYSENFGAQEPPPPP